MAKTSTRGRPVIIKEARPFIGGGDAATATLRKEFRLLRRLAQLRVAPQPVAYFREWEHSYLVEEYVEGDTLRSWLARRYPWLKTRVTSEDTRRYLEEIVAVFTRFATALGRVHDAGISMGDLSFHNCIVTPGGEIRLIDLETAIEEGLDLPVDMRTPGFASPRPLRDHPDAARAEDAYAFGANLLAAVMPVNAMLPLDRQVASRFVQRMSEDLGYPGVLGDVIASLLQGDATRRPSPMAAMAELRNALQAPAQAAPAASVEPVVDRADALFSYIGGMAMKARADRYVPAGPEVFQSHPWGVAHGAAGVLHAYLRGHRKPPDGLLDYVVDGARRNQDRGASLMHGDAGIAWVLFDAGERELAAKLLQDRSPDDAIRQRPGLHDGMAGWGFARIKAWRDTAEPGFLTAAAETGEILLRHAVAVDGRLQWPSAGAQPVGLAYGAAGIALFLLHLHVATGDERFLRAADAGLAYDLAQRGDNPDGDAAWPKETGGATLFPYLRHGTAGIVAVAARFHACTGDARYRRIVRHAEADLMRRHAISPGLFDGLAGMGETLLDLAEAFPDDADRYLAAAKRIAGGIEPFLVSRAEGFAVPGVELLRLSCDFATGNAGVGAFFDRLHRGGPASFMLDDHLSLGSLKFCDGAP